MNPPPADSARDPESERTGLPGLRSWRTVYLLVTIIFVVYALLLSTLTRMFQ